MNKIITVFFFLASALLDTSCLLFSQDKITPDLKETSGLIWQDEPIYRRTLKEKGLSDAVINTLVADQIALMKSGRNIKWSAPQQIQLGRAGAPCSGMGVEGGSWGAWQAQTGDYKEPSLNSPNPSILTFGTPTNPPAAPRFSITTGTTTDPCTPAPGGPTIPVVAPGFGNASIQLGVAQENGTKGGCNEGCAEQITYALQVTNQDTNFLYTFAYVVENPSIHQADDQPYVEFKILDSKGDTLKCAYQRYYGNSTTPGLYNALCLPPLTSPGDVVYKPWSVVGVNLSKYVGQVVTIVITNVDCSQGGHFAHSYWDFSCGVLSTNPASYCVGNSVSITAPSNPVVNYTYQWYKNNKPYTPNGTNQTIVPFPVPGDTFHVEVKQPSGCNFKIVYVPEPLSVGANFTYTTTCASTNVNFSDSAVGVPGVVVNKWEWTFQNGTPGTFVGQKPTPISFPPSGTYSVSLITTSQAGCKDTMVKLITIGGSPQAAFSSSPVCEGLNTSFTNTSVTQPGDPVASSLWAFPGGTPATSTVLNPSSIVYPAGNYTATLTLVTQNGCTSTVSQPVVVNPPPVVSMKGTNVCLNQKPNSFTDLTVANNSVSKWEWDFGDGNKSSDQHPTHTYGSAGTYPVSLSVTNNFGCKHNNIIKVIVNPLPIPNFVSKPVCVKDTTFFIDKSNINPPCIIKGWSWLFGDPASGVNNNSQLQNPWHVYGGTGPYDVLLTVTSDSGCQFSKTLQATNVPPPKAVFTAPNSCLNDPATLFKNISTVPSSLDSIIKWQWSFGDGKTSTLPNPSHIYTSSGTYTSTLVITTQAGCLDTTTNRVTIYGLPVAAYTDSAKGCAPVCTTFKDLSKTVLAADGSVVNWQWSFPGGNPSTSTSNKPSICWSTPGVYDVGLIVTTNFGCKDTMLTPKYINVYAWPKADFCIAPPIAPSTNPLFEFCDLWTKDVVKWTWNFGDGTKDTTSKETDPKHSYATTATDNDFYSYKVCLNVKTIHGCWDTICKPIDLLPEFEFYIPNCITPNDDPHNQLFFGKSRGVKEYNIWIFDRWGNLLWDCTMKGKNIEYDKPGQDGMSSACKWDGKTERGAGSADMNGNSGNLLQEDVYVWKVRLTDIFDKKHNYVGHVSIVK